MADPISPSPVAPKRASPQHAGAGSRGSSAGNIQDAVIRWLGIRRTEFNAGAFLARLAGRSDQDVMTYMTIPATISGGPRSFKYASVRAKSVGW